MIIYGSITKTMPDGGKSECNYMVDTDTKEVVQIGGEGEICAEEIDLIRDVLLRDTSNDPAYAGDEDDE